MILMENIVLVKVCFRVCTTESLELHIEAFSSVRHYVGLNNIF